jgi:D-sedoheptulose 7-phosphate isomerase
VSDLVSYRPIDNGLGHHLLGLAEVSRLGDKDAMLVYSVGGGDLERNINTNIVKAVDLAKAA